MTTEIKQLVYLPSRTGRHLQRYHDDLRLVVGCIPYRIRKSKELSPIRGTLIDDLEVLLISSQKSSRMMFPKGGWELDEDIELAASRETLEEAGVVGLLGDKLGEWIFKSKSQEKYHKGSMFPLFVTEELDVWPEKDVRRRAWMKVDEARKACTQQWMREALEAFICQFTPQQMSEEDEEDEEEGEDEEEEGEQSLIASYVLGLCRSEDLQKNVGGEVARYLIIS